MTLDIDVNRRLACISASTAIKISIYLFIAAGGTKWHVRDLKAVPSRTHARVRFPGETIETHRRGREEIRRYRTTNALHPRSE